MNSKIDKGARVAQYGVFGVVTMLCNAIKTGLGDDHFAVERIGDGGMIVTTEPIDLQLFWMAQSFGDGWLAAYREFKD